MMCVRCSEYRAKSRYSIVILYIGFLKQWADSVLVIRFILVNPMHFINLVEGERPGQAPVSATPHLTGRGGSGSNYDVPEVVHFIVLNFHQFSVPCWWWKPLDLRLVLRILMSTIGSWIPGWSRTSGIRIVDFYAFWEYRSMQDDNIVLVALGSVMSGIL